MIRDPKDVLDDVRVAVHARSEATLSALVVELIAGLCLHEQFPEGAFERLVSLLADPALWAHEDAWELVREMDASWELLTGEQRSELRPLLVASFDRWRNPMGAFVIGELLGGRYGDEEAFEALSKLAGTASLPARAFVPHGLEVLARHTEDSVLKQRAEGRLRELEKDEAEQVRDEAREALGRLLMVRAGPPG